MRYFYFVLLIFSICCSCEPTPEEKYANFFPTEQDSLLAVQEVLGSMRIELDEMTEEVNGCLADSFSCLHPTLQRTSSTFFIIMNQRDEIMVKNRFPRIQLGKIKPAILEYYQTNAKENDVTNNFPMYSKATTWQIQNEIRTIQEIIDNELKKEKPSQETIRIRREQISAWEKKAKLLSMLNTDVLREIHYQANIKIDYKTQTTIQNQVIDTTIMAFYELRDSTSQEHFNESYARIFKRYQLEKDTNDFNKLFALKTLFPIQVFVEPWINENTCYYKVNHPPEPDYPRPE